MCWIEKPPPAHRSVTAWLNESRDDENGFTRHEDPKRRLVTAKPGEWIVCRGKREQVRSVEVYR